MSEFGLKIKNYEAASIYEYYYGFRNNLDATDAMLTNSLFKDFLMENGLDVWKGESTRDVVCVQFGYKTKDFKSSLKRINDAIKDADDKKKEYLTRVKDNIIENEDYCKEISKNDLRIMFYEKGFTIVYYTHNKDGEVIKEDPIHYKMLYRTPGKAKKGTCMFIRDELYDAARNFLYMGIELPEHNAPIVEIGAYCALITSGIVDRIQIKPEQILIMDDVKSVFKTKVTTVNLGEDGHCYTEDIDGYEVTNELFDGQALIDSSIFPDWGNGYLLLRHHMTKMAAFHTNIEKFMREHYGDEYDDAYITDMFGRKVKVSDIKLITTNNAIKWLKFGVSFDYWADWVRKNDCMFGIVKTAHHSKFGDVQRMSYQMTNSLDIDSMEAVVEKSVYKINKLKSDDEYFRQYLSENVNFSNDFDVLVALCEHNKDFCRSDYYRRRKRRIIESYVLDFKSGRCLQNADNLTIVGSPYAMLLHSVGVDVEEDPTFEYEEGTIQCWTSRFNDDEYLAAFRSPHNSRNNIDFLHNVYHPYMDKYFRFGDLIIAVNMIHTDLQDRSNGSDQDSDSLYVTNQIDIVQHAHYCYINYPTIVNLIPQDKKKYDNTMYNYAVIDNALAAAQLAIGQSSNMAQICLSYTYNFEDKKYNDYVCILAVLAQVAIDNAKRKYAVDLSSEIAYISKNMDVDVNGYPKFWEITKKDKRKARNDEERKKRDKKNLEKIRKNINKDLVCPMNYLYDLKLNSYRPSGSTVSIKKFYAQVNPPYNRRKSKRVEEMIEKYSLDLYKTQVSPDYDAHESIPIFEHDFDKLLSDIRSTYISKNYADLMLWLIKRSFGTSGAYTTNTDKNRALLLKILYKLSPDVFLSCFITELDYDNLKK